MSLAARQITEYLSVGGLFNPEIMNQLQHEAVRDTLINARSELLSLEVRLAQWRTTALRLRDELCNFNNCGAAALAELDQLIEAEKIFPACRH